MKIKCECGNEWKKQKNLSAYEGEIVLVCTSCQERYFNSQDFFNEEDLNELDEICINE